MTSYKNWCTPGNQGVSLNPGGVRLQTGSGTALGMGSGGVTLTSRGDAELKGKNGIQIDMLCGKQISLKAGEYVYLKCGMSEVALLPEEIHIKGTKVQLESPLNVKEEAVFRDSAVETWKELYYNEKWGSPLQLFMPDGTVIGRVKGLRGNPALRKYFDENVLNTEGYENYLNDPALELFYEDEVTYEQRKKEHDNVLYLKWLSDTYGKTEMEKFGDWLTSREGIHTILDVVGIVFEPADVLNAVLYLAEGDWGNAAVSGISIIPVVGDFFGKREKYLLKASDLSKLKRNQKVLKTLDNIDIFIKARKADLGDIQKWIRKSWDEMLDGGGYVVEYVTPDGFIYKTRVSKDLRVNINLMDEAGDMLQETVRLGEKVGDGSELAGDVGKVVKEVSEAGRSADYFKYLEQLDDLSQNKINHIINGSKNSNHGWEKLVPDKNWNDIKNIIADVMDIGEEGPYKSVFSKKAIINGYEVEVTYAILGDGTIKISDAWINQ